MTEVETLDRELAEIDMLVAQARMEAERHELKRAQAAEKLETLPDATPPDDVVALNAQLVILTRRAAVMESQVEVLEGKRKALARFRDAVAGLADRRSGRPSRPGVELAERPAVEDGRRGRRRGARRPCRGSSSTPRRTSAARSPGRCTTGPPRA